MVGAILFLFQSGFFLLKKPTKPTYTDKSKELKFLAKGWFVSNISHQNPKYLFIKH
jgi:hypothetical protein